MVGHWTIFSAVVTSVPSDSLSHSIPILIISLGVTEYPVGGDCIDNADVGSSPGPVCYDLHNYNLTSSHIPRVRIISLFVYMIIWPQAWLFTKECCGHRSSCSELCS